jgi:hypothetical protein
MGSATTASPMRPVWRCMAALLWFESTLVPSRSRRSPGDSSESVAGRRPGDGATSDRRRVDGQTEMREIDPSLEAAQECVESRSCECKISDEEIRGSS